MSEPQVYYCVNPACDHLMAFEPGPCSNCGGPMEGERIGEDESLEGLFASMTKQRSAVDRLVVHKMSLLMLPPGAHIGTAIGSLVKPGNVAAVAREARAWVQAAILAVRQAGEPNQWKTSTDEEIAAEILRQVEAKKAVK